jgi:hypothetical protein
LKIVIIPDVHQNSRFCNYILDKEKNVDRYIFLGDFFDSFRSPPEVDGFEEACEYLKYLVLEHPQKDKFIFLLGNHDASYFYNNNKSCRTSAALTPNYHCSGVTKSKVSTFRKCFFDKGLKDDFLFDHFKLAHKEEEWTFSHAGIMISHLPYGQKVDTFINETCREALIRFRELSHPHNYLLTQVGYYRGGNSAIGGLLWCDWRSDFVASSDIGKQVVGHTTVLKPDVIGKDTDFETWCLDCNQQFYGVIEDKKLNTKNICKQY